MLSFQGRYLLLQCSSSLTLVIVSLIVSRCYFLGPGNCFCCLFYCRLKGYQVIHVGPYESCYSTHPQLLHCTVTSIVWKSVLFHSYLKKFFIRWCSVFFLVIGNNNFFVFEENVSLLFKTKRNLQSRNSALLQSTSYHQAITIRNKVLWTCGIRSGNSGTLTLRWTT